MNSAYCVAKTTKTNTTAQTAGASQPTRKGDSFLKVSDLTDKQLTDLFQLATEIKRDPKAFRSSLKYQHFALLFEKPSLRTRASFSVGIERLGGHAHFYDMQQEKIGARESVGDLAKNLEQWYQGVIARVDHHAVLKELDQHTSVAVINALCDIHHPCQALADFFTLYEINPQWNDWHLVFVGDANNVAFSLMELSLLMGNRMTLVTPSECRPNGEYWQRLIYKSEGRLRWTDDLDSVNSADAVYTDVWRSMGAKALTVEPKQIFYPYQINSKLMQQYGAQYFMHCQPVHRGEEATDEVCDGSNVLMYTQAANRMIAQQALILTLLGGSL